MQLASIRWAGRLAVMALVALGAGSAMADDGLPSSGLGQSWPSTTDVSASPHWHVYVFQRNGIRYIQVNDRGGQVRSAFAVSSGHFLALPVGADAAHLATPDEPLPVPASTAGEVVYQDASVKVLVAPQADGSVQTFVATGTCQDPIECSSRIN